MLTLSLYLIVCLSFEQRGPSVSLQVHVNVKLGLAILWHQNILVNTTIGCKKLIIWAETVLMIRYKRYSDLENKKLAYQSFLLLSNIGFWLLGNHQILFWSTLQTVTWSLWHCNCNILTQMQLEVSYKEANAGKYRKYNIVINVPPKL